MPGRLKRIRHTYQHAAKPLARLWRWAKAATKRRERRRRWRALARWAEGWRARLRERGSDDARVWRQRRIIYRRRERFVRKKISWLKAHRDPKPAPTSGVVTPERPWNPYRKPVAAWFVPWLDRSWSAGWRGVLNSGYRSPEYSEQLCYGICGAPSCPGRCAGRSSNHTQHAYPSGAVDVADYNNFKAIQYRIGSPLRNYLPNDPVHFSTSGR